MLERPAGSRGWNLADVCIDETGEGWIVGSAESQTEAQRSLVLHYRDGVLEDQTPPELAALDRTISRIECLPNGKLVMVAGPGRHDPSFGESALMIRYDGTWHLDWLPGAYSYSGVRGLAVVSDRNVWIAGQRVGDGPIFLHWVDGVWAAVEPPTLPDGRTDGYAVTDMTFVTPDEGWATAVDSTGPGFRGLIFHYKDGVWRNRNWNWHFWDQPGFGLFGE